TGKRVPSRALSRCVTKVLILCDPAYPFPRGHTVGMEGTRYRALAVTPPVCSMERFGNDTRLARGALERPGRRFPSRLASAIRKVGKRSPVRVSAHVRTH